MLSSEVEFFSGVIAEEILLSHVVAVADGQAVGLERGHHDFTDLLVTLVLKHGQNSNQIPVLSKVV